MTATSAPQQVINIVHKISSDKTGVAKWCSSHWRAILSEFLATALLVLIGCMCTIPIDGLPNLHYFYGPFGFGFVIMANLSVFAHISGSFMNPAVSLAALLYGVISIPIAIAYIIAECAGALVGYGILAALSPIRVSDIGVCTPNVHSGLNQFQALGIEIILTSVLNFFCCAVWDPINKDRMDSVPIKFGLTIAGLVLAGGPLTGPSMNPALTLGPSAWTGRWENHWIYWVGPLIGGILPTVIYRYCFLREKPEKRE